MESILQNTVILNIPYPSNYARLYGMNSLYAGKHWAVRKRDAEFWHTLVTMQLRSQNVPQKCFDKPVEITFRWNDRMDLSNEAYAAKMIEDALKGWVITDDSKKYVKAIHHLTHKENYISVEVEEWDATK